MRIVTLNLDLDDVGALQTAVESALASCACGGIGRGNRCANCATLSAIAHELDGLRGRSLAPGADRSPRQLLMPAARDAPARRGGRHLVIGVPPLPEA